MMKPGGWLLLWVAAGGCWTPTASAQLALFTVQRGVETPVGAVYNVGTVAVGDTLDTVFRLKNAGPTTIYLTHLTYDGVGFSSPDRPQLPAPIEGGGSLDFTIRFQPEAPGVSFSANLQIQDPPGISALLVATALPGFTAMLNNQPLANGRTLDFGSVSTGSTQTLKLFLVNPNQTTALTVPAVVLQGSAFQLAVSPQGNTVPGLSSAELDVVFAPTASGAQQGSLTIGPLAFPLQGLATSLPLPKPSIQMDLPLAASAQQGTLSVNLAAASQYAGSGTVTLAFQPAVSGVTDDPVIAFADGTLSASFTVAQGASAGQFSAGRSIQFMTGTTAGTLTFTVTLGDNTAQSTVTVPAAAIGIASAGGVRDVVCVPADVYCTATNVEVQITGWDNARTTSQIVFRFLDASGNAIAPGDIPWNGATAFQQYFATSVVGGQFALHARFPVTGDANRVAFAEVQLTNSVGTSSTQRIQF